MTDFLIPYTFTPGTKAKAQEVNANFNACKEAINACAIKEGDFTQKFLVADGSENKHAINKSQMDSTTEAIKADLTAKINTKDTNFCAKSGNVNLSGEADIFLISGLVVNLKIGNGEEENYPPLLISSAKGEQTKITVQASINMASKPDGTYNIFANKEGAFYPLLNTIYRQKTRPNMIENDVWYNSSIEPARAIKYSSGKDEEFEDVPVGKIKLFSGAISLQETFSYNQNGYDTNVYSKDWLKVLPDYTNGVSKSWNTDHTAEDDGYLYGSIHAYSDVVNYLNINGIRMWAYASSGGVNSFFRPVKKGNTYRAQIAAGDNAVMVFYPCVGVK